MNLPSNQPRNENNISQKSLISDDEYPKLFKIRKTVFQMLEDRGYSTIKDKELESLDAFKARFQTRESLVFLSEKKSTGELIYVEFSDKEKVGLDQLKDIGIRLFAENIKNGILIVKGALTSMCKQSLQEMADYEIFLETFEEKELIVNITEHELVPKHIILNKEEKDALLHKYKLKENQLPKILLTDPISKYLGLRRAQVVKIIRPSETAGKYITYRIAV